MFLNCKIDTLLWVLYAAAYLFFSSCSGPSKEEQPEGLHITDEEIYSAERQLLLRIDHLPGNILVEENTEFGAAEYFTGANISPDSSWIAIATSGAAHSAGWLVETETKEIVPASFQYGGSVTVGPWSGGSRFVSFIENSPAPSQMLSVVDVMNLDTTVVENATQVRLTEHEKAVPPQTIYEPLKWDEEELIFEVDAKRYRYYANTDRIQADDE